MRHLSLNFKPKLKNSTNGRAKILTVTIVALIAFLAGVQIVLSSQIAVTGEKIKNLETRKKELSLEMNRLQTQTNEMSSLGFIEEKAREEMGMVSGVERVEYIVGTEYLAILE